MMEGRVYFFRPVILPMLMSCLLVVGVPRPPVGPAAAPKVYHALLYFCMHTLMLAYLFACRMKID
jgi:hypothetical protein